jgi:arylsulfatase A-like enzyme
MNPGGQNFPNFGMPLDQPTLPELLHAAGYRTGMTGKWHLGNVREKSPVSRGFDEFFGFWGGLHGYVNLAKPAPGMNAIRKQDEPVGETEYLTDAIARESVAFIDHNHDKPFFLYVAFNAVHQPLQVPDKYLQRFPNEPEGKRRRMLAMLSAMDDAVGAVLAKLHEHKLEENTLVFFLSDNGGPTDGNTSSNAPLSGYKAQLFEGGIRIPFFARWPGHIAPGRVTDTPVNTLDIFATTMALAGAEWPKNRVHDGVDLTPWLTATPDKPVHDRLFWRYGPQWAVREGDWKVMGLKSRAKLFNLKTDIGEKHDLSADHPDLFARLRTDYDAWSKQLAEPMWTDPNWKMDDTEFDTQESPQKAQLRGGKKSVGED